MSIAGKKSVRTARKSAQKPTRRHRKGSGAPLTRELIVAAAIKLVDQYGLPALSMRRLGAELGVDPMAVYYYLPGKQALLDAIVEAVMASIDLSLDDPTAPAEQRIVTAACAYHEAMLAHVNALPIVLARGPATPAAMRPVELLTGILRDAGLPPAAALAGMNVIAAMVRGAVGVWQTSQLPPRDFEAAMKSLPAAEFPRLHEAIPFAGCRVEQFLEFGVRAITHGLLAEAQKKA